MPPRFCRPVGGSLSPWGLSEARLPQPALSLPGQGAAAGAIGLDDLAPCPCGHGTYFVTVAGDCALTLAGQSAQAGG